MGALQLGVSAVSVALPRLKTEEGLRALPYTDTDGNLTIGYGFNVNAGISKIAAAALLLAQLSELDNSLSQYAWYANAGDVRASVFLDIALNTGIHGLLAFPHMIAAAASGDWVTAAAQCAVADPKLDISRYAPLRALLLSG
jgi:lysozyme